MRHRYLVSGLAVLAATTVLPIASASAAISQHPGAHVAPLSTPPPDPSPYNPPCKSPRTVSSPIGNLTASLCDTWTKAPVENWVSGHVGSEHTVGYLTGTGYSNWFVCQTPSGTDGGGGGDWALTEADNGAWGAVSGGYYIGDSPTWPLPTCSSREISLAFYGH